MSNTADELVELIRGRIHLEFDGECHLTDTEAHRIANFLSEAQQREKDARRVALEEAALRVDAKADAYEEEARDLRGSDADRRFCASVAVRLRGASSDIRALQSEER